MKKYFLILLFILVFLLFGVNYKYSKFDLISNPSLSKETINIGENYYLGYGLKWNGFIKPNLVSIEMRGTDGLVLDENHEQLETTLFMDRQQHTGTLDEASFLEYSAKGYIDYIAADDARLEDTNTLVAKINLKDENYFNAGNTIILKYRILGFTKKQFIEIRDFFHE